MSVAEVRSATRKRRLLPAVCIALIAVSATGCNRFEARQKIREGNAYFKEGLYEDALKKYKEAQQLDPQEVKVEKFVAMGYMALYNPGSTHAKDVEAVEKAIEHFKKYLAAKPEDEKAAKYLVTTYMNSQRYDDAIAYFQDWFKKHPRDEAAVQTVAMLYAKKGDFAETMKWQEQRAKLVESMDAAELGKGAGEKGEKLDKTSLLAEIYYTMGVTCWDKAYNTVPDAMTPEDRRKIIDQGMEHLKKATSLKNDYFEAMFYINLLFREYAKLEADPAKIADLKAQADDWQKKGLEARKRSVQKQREEDAAKNPLEAL